MYSKTKKIIQDKYDAGVFPGVVYCLIDGEQEEIQVIGNAALLPVEEELTSNHLFDVASLTKVVCTTSVILKMVEKNQLDVDKSLQSYLPTFQDEKITLRHLLTHTSDIVTWIENRNQLEAKELRQAYLGLQSGENLGKKVQYTDAGTILLGFLLEAWYGKAVTDVFQEEILRPLKMTQSGFPPFLSDEKIVSTEQQPSGKVLRGITHDPKARILGKHGGNAGLFTTIHDLNCFVRSYFNPSEDFLNRGTIQALLKDQTPDGQGNRSLGWDLKGNAKQPFLYHSGYTGTFLLLNPQTRQGFIFLSNRVHPFDNREAYKKQRDEMIATYLAEIQG